MMPASEVWGLLVAFLLGSSRRKRRKDPASGRVHQGLEIACDRLRLARGLRQASATGRAQDSAGDN
jgi:hypothetical protein